MTEPDTVKSDVQELKDFIQALAAKSITEPPRKPNDDKDPLKIFVAGFPSTTTPDELATHFNAIPANVTIKTLSNSRTVAFISFPNADATNTALKVSKGFGAATLNIQRAFKGKVLKNHHPSTPWLHSSHIHISHATAEEFTVNSSGAEGDRILINKASSTTTIPSTTTISNSRNTNEVASSPVTPSNLRNPGPDNTPHDTIPETLDDSDASEDFLDAPESSLRSMPDFLQLTGKTVLVQGVANRKSEQENESRNKPGGQLQREC